MNNKTYNEIIRYLKVFATSHTAVKRFEEEDEDQMGAVTSMEETFPILFITPQTNTFNYDLNTYSLRAYCYDRLTKDRENNTNLRSKTNQILNDLDVWLRKEPTLPFEIDDTSNVFPMNSNTMTDVTGWYMDIVIDNPSFSECAIPFNPKPELPLGVCNEDTTFELGVPSTVHNDSSNPTYTKEIDCGDNLILPKENITINGNPFITKNSVEDLDVVVVDETGNPVGQIIDGEVVVSSLCSEQITVDFMDFKVVRFYSDEPNFYIDSVNNIIGTPTVNIEVNESPYNFGDFIPIGSPIDIVVDEKSLIKLDVYICDR